jgi:hypothetical protein
MPRLRPFFAMHQEKLTAALLLSALGDVHYDVFVFGAIFDFSVCFLGGIVRWATLLFFGYCAETCGEKQRAACSGAPTKVTGFW